MTLIFDLETDGLLDELTEIHSLVIYNTETDKTYSCCNHLYSNTQGNILFGLQMLQEASEIAGHNIVKFDIPAIQKLYPEFKPKGKIFDTLIASRLVFPDVGTKDDINIRHRKYPKEIRGRYSLKAWGYRLGELKGEYAEETQNAWDKWSPEMQSYCEQDVVVTTKLFNLLKTRGVPDVALNIEQRFQQLIDMQINHGALIDKDKLIDMTAKLQQKNHELELELQKLFPSKEVTEVFIPKSNNKTKGYVKGVPFNKVSMVDFNPNSAAHIAERLIEKYKWKPKSLTPTGLPKVSEEILETLDYPEIPTLIEYFRVSNALAKLSTGDTSLMAMMSPDGRVRGNVNPFGTGTRRCSHTKPNMTQIPKNDYLPFIKPRECIIPSAGYVLVGCDASGLELRCLAHYMGDIDYANEILSGDIHSKNQKAAGLPTRDNAKTFIYGFIYGAGDAKVGSIIGKGSKEGKSIKVKFLEAIPALGKLLKKVKEKAKAQGFLKSIDGAKVVIPKEYVALNYLLQGCGAIVMKQALINLYDSLTAKGWEFGREYAFILNCHDEIQSEVKPELVEEYKIAAVQAIRDAGKFFNFKCLLDGEAKEGMNWAETH